MWLATIVEPHPHHVDAGAWWCQEVLPSRSTVYFCRLSQLGLLRLLTNRAVMGPARRSPRQAWQDYDQLLGQRPVAYLEEPQGLAERLRHNTDAQEPSASLWTDAYLAAFATAERLELATFDRGFRRFSDLALVSLPVP